MSDKIKRILHSKRFVAMLMVSVFLLTDYLIYTAKKKFEVTAANMLLVDEVAKISIIGCFSIMLLLLYLFYIIQLDRNEKNYLTYTDEIIRKFFVPLNGMIGLSKNLKYLPNLNESQKCDIVSINDISVRLKKILIDIEDYNNYKKRQIKLNISKINLHELCEKVIFKLCEKNKDNDIKYINEIDKSLNVKFDSVQLQKAVGNILASIANFTVKNEIRIYAKKKRFNVELVLEDESLTMTKELKKVIFKPFLDANNIANGHYTGTGFSFAIVRQIMNIHYKRMWIGKNHEKKVSFHLNLTRVRNVNDIVHKFDDYNEPQNIASSNYLQDKEIHKSRVLLIKKNSVHKNTILSILHYGGFGVYSPKIPEEYINQVELDKYFDVVVIDEMDYDEGFDLCKEIRLKYVFSQLPILMMVPNDRQANLKKAFDVGANDCVDYLIMDHQLVAKVNLLCEIKKSTEEILDTKLSMYQSQIQPHFLYNALNVISELCITDNKKAQEVLIDFSQYLRSKYSYQKTLAAHTVEEEIALIKAYLNVEQARFKERLAYELHIDCDKNRMIPALIVQPFVENAVKHGISSMDAGGIVKIEIKEDGSNILISVSDNGVGLSRKMLEAIESGNSAKIGTGISNTMRRMQLCSCSNLCVKSSLYNGATFSFSIPFTWNYKKEA